MPLLALIGSLVGAGDQEGAAKNASSIEQTQFNTTTKNEQPFLQAGQNSLMQLLQGLGVTPGQSNSNVANGSLVAPFNPANLDQTPGYQFTLNQGLQGILDSASATGGVGGGNTLKAITNYGQGLASTTYQQQLQNYMAQQQQQFGELQNVAGSGQNAAANLGAIGAQTAGQIGSNTIGAGNAAAAGTVGATNAITNGASNIGSNYLLAQLLQGGGSSAASALPFAI